MEGCTWASVSDSPDAAAMGLDNRTSQCQAHPGALGFRRKERVEYAFKVFRRQPTPVSPTEITTLPSAVNRDPIVSSPPLSLIASIALSTRLINTCCSCLES